jgi:alkanesulfonate monooxygenase SsuD/methylene tetrahydromethanopterin reductase-like flavin-dependent oxidoreductase (luciferase family)
MSGRAISIADSAIQEKPGLARRAEEAGFDVIWNSGESVPVFASMLEHTSRARIGSGVIRAFQYEPRNLAQHAADLQRLYDGRFILGLGGGTKYMNINSLGRDFPHPASHIRELIRFLRHAWTVPSDEQLSFDGEYVKVEGAALRGWGSGGVEDASAPIYLAAVNAGMLRLAGDLCDGLCGHPIASVRFINEYVWPHIDEGLRRSGRTRADFDHQSWLTFAVSRDRAKALRELKIHVARFMATRSYGVVLDSQGYEDVRQAIRDAFVNHPDDHDALAAAIPDEVAAEHGLYGTPDDVAEQAQRYEGVIDTLCFYSASNTMDRERTQENLELAIEALGPR